MNLPTVAMSMIATIAAILVGGSGVVYFVVRLTKNRLLGKEISLEGYLPEVQMQISAEMKSLESNGYWVYRQSSNDIELRKGPAFSILKFVFLFIVMLLTFPYSALFFWRPFINNILGATLVLCFSIGLAITMVASGALAALSVKQVSKRWSGFGDFARKAPYFSGALIVLVGLYIGYQGIKGLMA